MQQLELLWRLQEVDLRLGELFKELEESPVLHEANYWDQKLVEKNKLWEAARQDLDKRNKELKKKEMQLQKASEEGNSLRKKMYGGEISSTRELEQMEKKLNKLEQDQKELEEQIIEDMEGIEELEEDKKMQEQTINEESSILEEKNEKWNKEKQKIEEEIAKLEQQREELIEKIEKPFWEKYQILSQRYRGKGLARVTSDICEGCRMFVSSAIKGRLYNLNTIVYCENCGRILVKLSENNE